MPDFLQVLLILAIIAGLGYGVYRYTRKSGSSGPGGRVGPSGRPNRDTDLR